MKTTILYTNCIHCSLRWPALLFVSLLIGCFAISPMAQAVSPAPDGGYGNGNTAEGTNALFSLTNGATNTGIGVNALFSLRTGSQNTAVGANALKNNTASQNTAVGFQALLNNTSGSDNTANGAFALIRNSTGSDNTAVGGRALSSNTTATLNTGAAALVGVVAGDTVTLSTAGATGTFSSKTVAVGKTVTVAGLTIAGTRSDRIAGTSTLSRSTSSREARRESLLTSRTSRPSPI